MGPMKPRLCNSPQYRTRPRWPRHAGLALVLLASLLCFWSPATRLAPAARASSLERPLHRCRGATRAHVKITWPTAGDLAINSRLHWGAHVSSQVRRWAYLIVPDATAAGIDPYLVAGVMRAESNGDPLIWNLDSDARGLMQVLHASFEPAVNVRLGVSTLAALVRQFGTQDLALAAYNAGPGSVQNYGGIPPFTETRDYIVLVDYWRDRYAGLRLSAARITRFKAALADLRAYERRICGTALSSPVFAPKETHP